MSSDTSSIDLCTGIFLSCWKMTRPKTRPRAQTMSPNAKRFHPLMPRKLTEWKFGRTRFISPFGSSAWAPGVWLGGASGRGAGGAGGAGGGGSAGGAGGADGRGGGGAVGAGRAQGAAGGRGPLRAPEQGARGAPHQRKDHP